jgi:hypothetical protein
MEINGIIYERRDLKKPSGKVLEVIALAQMFGGLKVKTLNVNIIEEFKLIQLKKSKLSRADRDFIERKFNNHFKKVV